MTRFIMILLCATVLGVSTPSAAQNPPSPSPAPVSLSAEQARAALEVLNDPAKRAAFAATLNAIVKARPKGAPSPSASASAAPDVQPNKPPAAEPTGQGLSIPLAPDSLGADVVLSASAFVNRLSDRVMLALNTVQSLPLLYGWLVVMATNPLALSLLADVVWRAALVLVCVTGAAYGLRRAIQGPIGRMERRAPVNGRTPLAEPPVVEIPETDDTPAEDALARAEAGESEAPRPRHHRPSAWTLLRRLPLVLARLFLELVPVLGILVVGHLMAGSSLGGQSVSRLIIVAIVSAYALCAALLSVARTLLSPDQPRLRPAYLSDATSRYMMGWTHRLALIAVFGYAIGEVGLLLGLSNIAHDAIQKAVGLVLHLCLAYIVLRNRRSVRRWLRSPQDATGLVATTRNYFAYAWHWVALFFLTGGWLIWAVEMPHGFAAVLHYFAITVLLLIGTRLLLLLLLGVVDKVMRPTPDVEGFYHGMQDRLHAYHPVVSTALRMTIYLLCVLSLLQLYGLNTILWLASSMLGQRILSASATLLVTVILAIVVWEAVTFALQRHVERLQADDHPGRSARLRTLLPLLRTSLLISIAIVAGLMVLSEIGINIGPLLAGAGIVGVAIGFGSQKLVQDLITGVFLLLENARWATWSESITWPVWLRACPCARSGCARKTDPFTSSRSAP
jgi:hypothetical protein